MISLNYERTADPMGMKKVYSDVLCDLAANDPKVVAVDADLGLPSGSYQSFGMKFPERYINVGIQEANMSGVANGLSSAGLIPFTHTFGCFVARKCADQIFLTGCFADQNVKIIGSDPGLTSEYNGASHAGNEEMGMLMGIPNITLVDPCDPIELEFALRQCKEEYGMFYIRYNRKLSHRIYKEGTKFEFGKANLLKDGKDATVIASGIMLNEALQAAEKLEKEGISARIVDMFTWKPIDEQMIIKCAKETGAIVTAENHNAISGLGAAVARVIAKDSPVPMGMIGVQDQFGQVGKLDFLKRTYKMTADDIAEEVKAVIKRK